MRNRLLKTGAVTLLLFAVSACSYLGNRVADLSDVFVGELTFGPGIDVHAEVTSLFGTSLGLSKQWGPMMQGRHVGMGGRNTDGILVAGSSDVSGDMLVPLCGDKDYVARMRTWVLFLRYPPWVPVVKRDEWPRLLDVGFGGSFFVGVHLGFSPLEAVDFLLGLTTLDIVGDDCDP